MQNLLAQRRRALGLTQAELANRAAMSTKSVSDFETRALPRRVVRLKHLADVMGISLDALVGTPDPK